MHIKMAEEVELLAFTPLIILLIYRSIKNYGVQMLLLKPNCESCNKDLPPDSTQAMICSFECTFCQDCMDSFFNFRCPNCDGDVCARPTRDGDALKTNPASDQRVCSDYEIRIIDGKKSVLRTKLPE